LFRRKRWIFGSLPIFARHFFSFDLSREVVAISMDLFDRYFATLGNKCSGNMALLTSLTTLHIAIKIHDTKKIKLSTLANLSRGQFGPKDIEATEWKILAALGWKLHPPTQYAFISHLLLFLPQEANPSARSHLYELSRYLTELTVCDSYFVDVNNSTTAFAALLNVIEDMSYSRLSAGIRENFLRQIASKIGLHYSAESVVRARQRLRRMFASVPGPEDTAMQHTEVTPPKHHHHHKTKEVTDGASLADVSLSSVRSTRSINSLHSITNSIDSKGSCRYSPSPRRHFVAAVSPLCSSRAHRSASPIVAGVQ
jgi:hypothetical protein